MKKLLTGISVLLIATASFAEVRKADSISDGVVNLRYLSNIEGYRVEAVWKPNSLMNGFVIGPAIVQLTSKDHGGISTVVTNHFSLSKERVDKYIDWKRDEGSWILDKIINKNIELDYTYPEIKNGPNEFGTTKEPFFFYDLNFDEKKELLVSEVFTGQRWTARFKAYELNGIEGYSVLEDNFQQITNKEPYSKLDSLSTVDKKEKSITIHVSAGAMDSENIVYKLKKDHIFEKVNQKEHDIDKFLDECIDQSKSVTAVMVKCGDDAYRMWDDELNRYYKLLMASLDEESEKKSLKQAQRAWIKFRDKEFEFIPLYFQDPGSYQGPAISGNKLSIIKHRALELKSYYDIVEAGLPESK